MPIMQPQTSQWIYVLASVEYVLAPLESEKHEIGGLKIWKHPWKRVEGENAHVIDPIYGAPHVFAVYQMEGEGKIVEFAAGEFSNGVWGFYVRNPRAA